MPVALPSSWGPVGEDHPLPHHAVPSVPYGDPCSLLCTPVRGRLGSCRGAELSCPVGFDFNKVFYF